MLHSFSSVTLAATIAPLPSFLVEQGFTEAYAFEDFGADLGEVPSRKGNVERMELKVGRLDLE